MVDLLAELWAQYPLAKDVVDRLGEAVAHGRREEIAALLGPAAVTLPDGRTMFVGALIDDLRSGPTGWWRRRDGWRRPPAWPWPASTRGATALRGLVERAGAVGAAGDVEVAAATAALLAATDTVAADPTADGPVAALDRALAGAGRRVAELEKDRGELPTRLAGARADLDELRRLVAAGADGAALARAKIADPAGLLDPVDPLVVDGGGDDALAPWLARIEADVNAGGWKAAAGELDRWRRAHRWLADARLVATANGKAVARRNELRGLLQAFRAKSAAMGRAEDPELIGLHQSAEQALHVAPCDLPRAEALVAEYLRRVNSAVPGGRR